MVLALSEAAERALGLGIAAAGALAVWFALLAVLALASRPRLPDPAPASPDIPGREAPAVVGFVVNRWEVGRETVPATLLDLAARRAVAIEQVAPERFVVRLRQAVPADLAPYERQVLDHIRGLASGGVVPCEALTTGPEEQSKGWWDRFRKAVVADARARGLSRSRWSKPALVTLGVAALVPALLAAAAFVLAPSDSSSSSDDDPVEAFLGAGAAAWFALMAIPYSLRAERDTGLGREAAARWLGLRHYLDEDEAFDQAPPAAVAIWDRYLAYGAAMGVAAGAVRALPLGAESDTEAWSAYGGHWHVVRVRYPEKFPPGWGRHPLAVTVQAVATLLGAVLAVRAIGPALADVAGEVLETSRAGGWEGWALAGLAVFGAIVLAAAVYVARAVLMLVLAVPDLFARVEVEGLVIRLRAGYVAVDDGAHARVRAWRLDPVKLAGVARGTVARVTVSPRLGHVFAVERVDERPRQAGLQAAGVATPPPSAAVPDPGVDLGAIEARCGVRLQVPAGTSVPAFPGADRAFLLSDGREGEVFVVVSSDRRDPAVPGGPGTAGVTGRLLRWAGGRGSAPVEGLGDEATWAARRSVLTARRGDRHVTVVVGLQDLAPERRLDVARAVAEAML